MRRQVTAQQLGIAACQDHMDLHAQQPVYEERPPCNILYLIKEYVFEIPVDFVQHFENIVQLIGTKTDKTLVVEIRVCKQDTGTGECLQAEG